jgi:ribosomal-protein-alanine N-acetyltransferase
MTARFRPRLLARGPRVYLRAPRAGDAGELTRLNRASARLHRRLISVPRRAAQYASYLRGCREPDYVGLLVCRLADGAIVGAINFFDLEGGIVQAACVGYYVGAPFAGRGYMTEALGLALRHAFVRLGLHRVEADIEPDNVASIRLVRRLGFTREGLSRRYLKLRGRWRDHERWAILAEDWRAGAGTTARAATGRPRDPEVLGAGAGARSRRTSRRAPALPHRRAVAPTATAPRRMRSTRRGRRAPR